MAESASGSEQPQTLSPKEQVKRRILEEQAKMRIRDNSGEYKFDNPDLEHKTKRQRQLVEYEDKYKDKPKIAFHELTEEGDRLFMQAKRDRVWNTLGWSVIGNIAAIGVVQFLTARPPKRWQQARYVK